MILVNFLPKELQPKTIRHTKLPIIPIMILVFVIFILISLYNLLIFSRIGIERRKLDTEWQKLKAPSEEAEKLNHELKTGIVEEVHFFRMFLESPVEMAHILNIVSDHLPSSIWLTDFDIDRKKEQFRLSITGYSEYSSNDTKLVEIQNFTTAVKDGIESVLKSKNILPGEVDPNKNQARQPNQAKPGAGVPAASSKSILKSSFTTSSKMADSQGSNLTQFVITIQTEGYV